MWDEAVRLLDSVRDELDETVNAAAAAATDRKDPDDDPR